MEETTKLIEEIYMTTSHFSQMTKYEKYDIGIKILSLQEQRKAEPLTKREYFAGVALQGFLANPQDKKTCMQNILDSILIADTLIEELNKTNQSL
ncbi:MAG: hypothetical protein ACOVNU_14005 [Candidatus Kapaibacteriota bacterium]